MIQYLDLDLTDYELLRSSRDYIIFRSNNDCIIFIIFRFNRINISNRYNIFSRYNRNYLNEYIGRGTDILSSVKNNCRNLCRCTIYNIVSLASGVRVKSKLT